MNNSNQKDVLYTPLTNCEWRRGEEHRDTRLVIVDYIMPFMCERYGSVTDEDCIYSIAKKFELHLYMRASNFKEYSDTNTVGERIFKILNPY
jgi:hypothetical protein